MRTRLPSAWAESRVLARKVRDRIDHMAGVAAGLMWKGQAVGDAYADEKQRPAGRDGGRSAGRHAAVPRHFRQHARKSAKA